MPFADDQVRIDLACGPDETGRWHGYYGISVDADALRRVGLLVVSCQSNSSAASVLACNAASIRAPVPSSCRRANRLYNVFRGPYRSGTSRHGAPGPYPEQDAVDYLLS